MPPGGFEGERSWVVQASALISGEGMREEGPDSMRALRGATVMLVVTRVLDLAAGSSLVRLAGGAARQAMASALVVLITGRPAEQRESWRRCPRPLLAYPLCHGRLEVVEVERRRLEVEGAMEQILITRAVIAPARLDP